MIEIPLQAAPSQITKIVLGGQACQIFTYQKRQGLFFDLSANGFDIVTCVLARNAVPLVFRTYTGFVGNLIFIDNQGEQDPYYDGLGSRYSLVYFDAAEAANVVV